MITVVILARNEAKHLVKLLPTLDWADQVVVVDDNSTDEIANLCKRFKVKRLVHPLDGDYGQQRNYVLNEIKQGWVLFLDADERVTRHGVEEILAKVRDRSQMVDGFSFKRQDIFHGKPLRYGETGSVRLVRLGRVGSGEWVGKVHEVWKIKKTSQMNHPLVHYSHESAKQLFSSVSVYAKLRSRELFEQKQYWSLWEHTVYPVTKFVYTFIVLLGVLDGWRGLTMSVAMSWHSWLVRWFLWESKWLNRRTGLTILRYVAMMPWILLPFGQFTRGTIGGTSFYGFEVFMAITLVVAGLTMGRRIWQVMQPSWMGVGLMVTLSWLLSYGVSLIQGYPWEGGLYWMRWCMYMGYGLVLWQLVGKDGALSISGLARYLGYGLLLFGLTQYILFPDMRWLSLLGWDDHYYRMVGTLFDPNYFGLMAVLGGWWVLFKTRGWERKIMLVTFVIAILATFSRTSMAAGAVLALLYGIRSKQMRIVVMMTVLAIGIFIVLPKPGGEGVNLLRSFSINSRIESWGKGWELFKTHPVLGIGFNQYPAYLQDEGAYGAPFHPSAPDNSLLYVLVTSGIVGTTLFLILIRGWWVSENDIYSRGALVAILIHSMTNNSFFYPWVLLWWWLVILGNKEEKQRLS